MKFNPNKFISSCVMSALLTLVCIGILALGLLPFVGIYKTYGTQGLTIFSVSLVSFLATIAALNYIKWRKTGRYLISNDD